MVDFVVVRDGHPLCVCCAFEQQRGAVVKLAYDDPFVRAQWVCLECFHLCAAEQRGAPPRCLRAAAPSHSR